MTGIDQDSGKRPTIGVLAGWQAYGGTLDTFLSHIFSGILAAAQEHDCHLLLACGIGSPRNVGLGRPAWPLLLPDVDFCPVGPWNADGLLVLPPFASEAGSDYFHRLAAGGYPIVFAGDGEPGPSVTIDNEGGIRQAVAHLVEHSHRRIAFIAGREHPRHVGSRLRLTAFKAALQEWSLAPDGLIAYGSHTTEGGRQAMEQILHTGRPFTALLASNDESAVGAMEILKAHGRLIPQDVAVIGFDDRLEARAQLPSLTTVRFPMFELGHRALALLLERIRGTETSDPIVRVPTQLIVRESCGCLAGLATGASLPERTSLPTVPARRSRSNLSLSPAKGFDLVGTMARAVSAEMQRINPEQARYLCERLIEALVASQKEARPSIFLEVMQQILSHTASLGDDPNGWQLVLSILGENLASIPDLSEDPSARHRAKDTLDQARIAISSSIQDQLARYQLRQANITYQLGQMVAQFHVAQTEAEIYDILARSLPLVGIEQALVAFYEPEGEDPVAWSILQSSARPVDSPARFRTRDFPPAGVYPVGKPLSLALLPLLIQDELRGFVALDTSNLEIAGDVVRHLGSALRGVGLYREAVQGRRLAEEANRLKSRFLAMVSHELRTPLNLISGLSDMLLRERSQAGPDQSQVHWEDVERIYANAQHLDDLIRDVLDLAQSEAGQLNLVREPLDLGALLATVSLVGEQLTRNKGLVWQVEAPTEPIYVWGDRTRLRQVLLNLVHNASKFTTEGEIALTATMDEDRVLISVRDTGLGIPLEEQTVIFDEFRQSDRTATRGYGGLGLGLAICKRLVELHDGEIGVYSSGEEGEGSTFVVSLPTIAPEQARLPEKDVPLPQKHVALLAKQASTSRPLQEHLAARGFEVRVHTADRVNGWLSDLFVEPPTAAIIDLDLASECGWQVIKQLKENPSTQDVPVTFVSLAESQGTGATVEIDYLSKPMGSTELSEALQRRGLTGCDADDHTADTILVVDDEPGILEMHARIVEAQLPGCRVLRARNGMEALRLIEEQSPVLVLLDLMMPELDGFGVLEAMQEHALSRSIPVIVLTGQMLTEEDMSRLNRGVTRVLEKGLLSVQETLAHVEAALDPDQRLNLETRRIVRQAMAYIHAYYAEPLSRADISSAVGLSERHLARCFRQEMHMTPHSYLNRYRVRQAKQLLSTSGKSITEVALEVGFSSSGYFSQVFRQDTGVSPSEYRRGEA